MIAKLQSQPTEKLKAKNKQNLLGEEGRRRELLYMYNILSSSQRLHVTASVSLYLATVSEF